MVNDLKNCEELFSTLVFAPKFTTQTHPFGLPQDIDEQIVVFKNRIRVWILDYAEMLTSEDNAGFAILTLLNSLPEMIAQFQGFTDRNGNDWSANNVIKGDLFKEGIKYLFPEVQGDYEAEILNLLWSNTRSAIAHMGLTSTQVVLHGGVSNLTLCKIDNQIAIVINPTQWYLRVSEKIEEYILNLENPSNHELRQKFRARLGAPN